MMKPKSRGGRPGRTLKPGERVALSFRIALKLKHQLDAAADLSGRSQSQEAEFRLERSFDREGLLPEALELAYGRELGGLLLAMGHVIAQTGRYAGFAKKGFAGADDWIDDPYAYGHAARAAAMMIEAYRPAGEPTAPDYSEHARLGNWDDETLARYRREEEDKPRMIAASMVGAIRGKPNAGMFADMAEKIRGMLGAKAKRLKISDGSGEQKGPKP